MEKIKNFIEGVAVMLIVVIITLQDNWKYFWKEKLVKSIKTFNIV